MARAYSVFANGGYRDRALPHRAHRRRPRQAARAGAAGDSRRRGAARDRRAQRLRDGQHDARRDPRAAPARARLRLGRKDLAGKTGTTNDHVDAWFAGYQPTLVGIAWIGFDQPKKLGANETGGAGGAADLDRLHADRRSRACRSCRCAMPEGVVSGAHRSGDRPAAATTASSPSTSTENVPPAGAGDGDRASGGTRAADEVRSQLF